MKIDETLIRASLAMPELFAGELVAILNDRGARDAAIVITARNDEWASLQTAAAIAGLTASQGTDSTAGPLVTLASALWIREGADSVPMDLLAAIPASDPAHKMAELLVRVIRSGIPATLWAAAMAKTEIATCLAFGADKRAAA